MKSQQEEKKSRGRPVVLTDIAKEKLMEAMQKNPLEYGLPYSIWDKHTLLLYYDMKKLEKRLRSLHYRLF